MKSTLMIKDLALDKQLDRKSMSAVRGGNNFGFVGGQNVRGGGAIFAVNAPTLVQTGDTTTTVDIISLSNALGTMNTRLAQF